MAGAWVRASILLQDNAANIARVAVLVLAAAIDPGGGAIAALQAAIQAVTKARSPRTESGTAAGEAPGTPTTGNFAAVEDRAVLTFSAADGSTEVYEVPAPTNECFLSPDFMKVDPAGDLMDVITFYTSTGKSKFNQALTYVKGKRSRKKQMKR